MTDNGNDNVNEILEQELTALGEELRRFSSVAANVMSAIAEPPPPVNGHAPSVVIAARSVGVFPAESTLSTGMARGKHEELQLGCDLQAGNQGADAAPLALHEKVQAACGLQAVGGYKARPRSRWVRGLGTVAASAAVVAVFAVVISTVMQSGSVALAQVQERLSSVRTASLRMQHTLVVTYDNGETTTQRSDRRVFIRHDGRVRIELPEGRLSVSSEPDFKLLDVDPVAKTAKLTYLYALNQKRDIITTLRSLHQNQVAQAIDARKIDGRSCPGFRIEEQYATLLVWVDSATRLPVQAERLFPVLNEVPPTNGGPIRRGKTQITETYADMKFDEPLPDKLFDVSPPSGYALTTVGTPPADRRELFAQPLVLTPLKGAGPLRFGMPEAEVFQLLGNPDKTEVRRPTVPITDDTHRVGDQPRPPGGQLVVLTELHFLEFKSLGLRLTTEVKDGLTGIMCLGQELAGASVQDFKGSTDKGIRVRSPEADVRKAYGEPDKHVSTDILVYGKLGLQFQVTEDRAVRSISASDGIERQLRFEWRVPQNAVAVELPLGKIVRVDTDSNTVTINLGKVDHLRKRTTFSVYRQSHSGVARGTEGIKGSIEVTEVMGPHLALAKITGEMMPADPIAPGNPIYTPAWSPGQVEKFAFVSKFDFDGDGKHDLDILYELLKTNGAVIGAEVDQKGLRNDVKIDRDTKFLVVGDIPEPTSITDPVERRTAEDVLRHLEAMKQEAAAAGVAVVGKNDFLNWMGYRPQYKLYKPGQPRYKRYKEP